MRLLLISDIHGNFPALRTVWAKLSAMRFDYILNSGDSLVYAPFPNQTLNWLQKQGVISILGNTDKKVIKLLKGKTFKKPGKPDKVIMYTSTAASLNKKNSKYLKKLPTATQLELSAPQLEQRSIPLKIGLFHGSPAKPHEFLFETTPESRFEELAMATDSNIVITGHSHTPYHKFIADTHFINPGSVGRMFDGTPKASCATLEIAKGEITVSHYRITYPVKEVVDALRTAGLPELYCEMYQRGKKLN